MKYLLVIGLALPLLFSCVNDVEEEVIIENYKIAENSVIEWKGIKSENYFHTGTLSVEEGKVSAIEDSIVSGDFTLDMLSINVTDLEGGKAQSLQNHLMGLDSNEYHKPDDFFQSQLFPEVGVKISGYDGKNLNVVIDILGTKLEKSLPITSIFKKDQLKLEGEFMIDLTESGVKGLQPNPETGEKLNVEIKMNLTLNKSM